MEKLNENYNFLLLSILIAGWSLGWSLSFANFPGFRGEASPPPPGYATDNMHAFMLIKSAKYAYKIIKHSDNILILTLKMPEILNFYKLFIKYINLILI